MEEMNRSLCLIQIHAFSIYKLDYLHALIDVEDHSEATASEEYNGSST